MRDHHREIVGRGSPLHVVMQRTAIARAISAVMMMGGLGACAGGGPPKLVASGATADVRPAVDRRCPRWIVGATAATAEQRVIVLGGG